MTEFEKANCEEAVYTDIEENQKVENPVSEIACSIAMIVAVFLNPMYFYFAYRWIAWNFNLPEMGYWIMFCMVNALAILFKMVLGKPIINKK